MKIFVKTHANLGSLNKYLEVKEDIPVRQLLSKIGISEDLVFLIIINGKKSDLDSVLKEGDSLSLFPSIGGG
jgi:molybdopterin converting factor small subunit